MENTTYYFEEKKPENTDVLLDLVKKKALGRSIKYIVVASTRGGTGVKTAEVFKGLGVNVIVVTHQIGPSGPELLKDNEEKIKTLGAKIITCTHAFGGVGSSLKGAQFKRPSQPTPQDYWPPYTPPIGELIANVLRIFSQGMKVCIEITLMAADAGAIPIGESVIAIAGQGGGADTAIIIKSANANSFFDLDVQEIIAKPIKKSLPVLTKKNQ